MPSYRTKTGRSKSVQAIIRLEGHKTITKQFKTKSEAKQWATITEEKITQGLYEHRKFTFREASILYGVEHQDSKEISYLLKRLRKSVGHLILGNQINHQIIVEYRNMRSQRVSPATVNKELTYILRVHSWVKQEMGLMIDIPKIRMLKVPMGRDRRVSEAELQQILKHSEPTMKTIIKLAIATGMRRGEIVKIQRKDISYQSRTVHLFDTKNGEDRVVPLSTVAIRALKQLPARIDGEVFGIHPDTISKRFLRACRDSGIEGLRFHDLRHEAVSRLFEKGLNPMEVATISGHKTLQMLKRYTHLKAEDLAKKLG